MSYAQGTKKLELNIRFQLYSGNIDSNHIKLINKMIYFITYFFITGQ